MVAIQQLLNQLTIKFLDLLHHYQHRLASHLHQPQLALHHHQSWLAYHHHQCCLLSTTTTIGAEYHDLKTHLALCHCNEFPVARYRANLK